MSIRLTGNKEVLMKRAQRILSAVLTLTILIGLLPAPALAVAAERTDPAMKPTEVPVSTGETVEIGDDWEEKYPYGAFLFGAGNLSLIEGGDAVTIPVYRMGGNHGRATLRILFNPMKTQVDEETVGVSGAAGFDDLTIEVEDPLPVAAYQAVGKDPDPEPGNAKIVTAPYNGDDAEEGDRSLSVTAAADAWQWYVLDSGVWQAIEDAAEDHLVVGGSDMAQYDFRCVYTVEGVRYCTASFGGVAYEKPEPEAVPPMPDDLDLAPEQSFSAVLPEEGSDPADQAVFEMTFASDEWVKYLRLQAKQDTVAEPMKLANFTMLDSEGGAIYHNGGTLILSIEDDEAPEPFTLGFEAATVEADRAEGTAYLTVERTGGNQIPVSVHYHITDGSAVAGQDYEAVSGQLFFYADTNRQTIAVPLIDSGDTTDKRFSVTLETLQGNEAGIGSLARTEATVTITGDGAPEQRNMATLLSINNRNATTEDPGDTNTVNDVTEDVSGLAVIETGVLGAASNDGPIGGEQVVVSDEDLLRGELTLGAYGELAPDQLQTYQFGRISFAASGSKYWSDTAYVAGDSQKDYTGWTDGEADGNGWILKSRDKCSARLNIPHMAQYFSSFYGTLESKPEWSDEWVRFFCSAPQYVYGVFRAQNKTTDTRDVSRCDKKTIWYYPTQSVFESLDCNNANDNWLQLELIEIGGHSSDTPAWVKLSRGTLSRRSFGQDLSLTIHTANDGESGGGNVPTAPEGAAALKAGSGVYESMKPTVTVVPGAGGTTYFGRLYVGSKLKVSLNSTPSYIPYTRSQMYAPVYLTDDNGNVVHAPVERSGDDYYITMIWDGITENDIRNGHYTVNVVMDRRQNAELDLSPSVERLKEPSGKSTAAIDPKKVPQALDLFWSSAADSQKNYIAYGTSMLLEQPPFYSPMTYEEKILPYSDASSNPLKALGTMENVQYINFNRSPRDRIVYHGKAYAGNETIWLTVADLAASKFTFLYYNADYLYAESIMNTSVDSVGIYWDGNCDGKINGYYDDATGYFVLDRDSGDSLYYFMAQGENRSETFFQPTKDEDGRVHEFIAKIFYTMTPRAFAAPEGKQNDKAQVLPALTTTVTDAGRFGELTEAEQSYRYVVSGQAADGRYTSDGHIMYGPEATAVQYVDVRMGGDHSPAEAKNDKMVWTPDYHGYLLKSYEYPEPIILEHSMLGDAHPLTDFTVNSAGQPVLTGEAKAQTNAYLGAMVGNSTIALCTMAQKYPADKLAGHMDAIVPESSKPIGRSVFADAGDSLMNSGTPDNPGMSDGCPTMDSSPLDVVNLNADVHNAGFNFSLPAGLNFVKTIFTEDGVQALITVPIVAATKGKEGVQKGPDFSKYREEAARTLWVADAIRHNDLDELTAALEKKDKKGAGKLSSKKFSGDLTFLGVFAFKYNRVQDEWYAERRLAGSDRAGGF